MTHSLGSCLRGLLAPRALASLCGSLAVFAASGCGSGSSGASPGGGGSSTGDAGFDIRSLCTWNLGTGSPTPGAAPTQNDSADISGATIGTHPFDTTTQRRTVPVTVTVPLSGLDVGSAYLTRLTPTDETAYVTIPVTNSGSDTPCFISTKPYRWLDSGGNTLNTTNTEYVHGSVRSVSSTLNTNTCLAPGEMGYIIGIEIPQAGTALYSAVASMQIGLTNSGTGTDPGRKLLPTKLDVGTCPVGGRALRLTTTASGGEVSLGSTTSTMTLGPMIYLDADGLPDGWTYVTQSLPANLNAGSSIAFYDDVGYGPTVTRVRAFVPFEPPNSALVTLSEPMAGAVHAEQAASAERFRRLRTAMELHGIPVDAWSAGAAVTPGEQP